MEERIVKMWSHLKSASPCLKWFIGREIFSEVKKLEMTIGVGVGPLYVPRTLLGIPIKLIEANHIILGIDE